MCVLWRCSRPGRAPRRTGIAAEAIRCCGAVAAAEYARANEVLCGALWPQPAAQQALQRVSVSLSHMLAADLGAAFGAMAAVPPVGGARITAASALGLRAARESCEPIMVAVHAQKKCSRMSVSLHVIFCERGPVSCIA